MANRISKPTENDTPEEDGAAADAAESTVPEAVADAGNGDDEASTGAPGTDAPETEADSDGAPAAVDHETTNDDPAVAVPDATPTVTVIAGPAAPDVDVLGLKVPAASTDPAFTGAVQTITPVTTGPIPAQPASAPGAFPMPTNTAGPKPVTEPVQTADAALVQEAAVPPVPEVPPLPEVPPVPEAAPGWEPPTAGAPTGSPRRQREDGPEPAAALTSDRLLNKVAAPPVAGWRRWLYTLTFGTVNLGDSDKVRLERARENVIASRLGDHTRFVPVLSRKGGVGKTTVTTLLGMVLADIREDRVIAMDANPDRGTLSDRSPGSADFTARNLVRDRFTVTTFSQLSDYVARDGSRLDVLASDTDPAIAQAFDDSDYRAVTDILSKYYSVVLTDSGTGMVHSVMKGTLEKADAVVLVSGGSVDEARLASETLSWLEAHGRHDLVSNATVVINMSGGETQVDIDQIEEHFKSRVRNVLRIPYDKHLAEGSRVELAKLRPATLAAVKELASLVVTELQKGQPRKG